MQLILSKSSLILFKTRYPLVVYPENADVLPFIASLQSKSYFSPLKRGYQCRLATWFCSGSIVSILMCCVLVGSTFLRGTINTKIFKPFLVTGLLQLSSLNFGFSSLNQMLKFWPRLLTSIAVRFFNDILYRLSKTHV